MEIVNTNSAVKTLKKAIPTVDANGHVVSWNIFVEYSFNNFSNVLNDDYYIEIPSKAPIEYTKEEIFSMVNIDFFNQVFESQYNSIVESNSSPENILDDVKFN